MATGRVWTARYDTGRDYDYSRWPYCPSSARPSAPTLNARPDRSRRTRRGAHRAADPERSASALMLSTALTVVLGALFWMLAARLYPPAAMGRASATVSAMTLLAGVAQLNMASVFQRFLPLAGRHTRTFVVRGYSATLLAASVLLIGFLGSGVGDRYLPRDLPTLLIFAVSVLLYAVYFVQDGALTALRSAAWVPVENGLFALAKLLLLPLFAVFVPGAGAFLTFSLPVIVVVGVVSWFLFGRLVPTQVALAGGVSRLPPVGEIRRFVAAEYGNSILASLISYGPPVLVAQLLGTEASAYLAVPWLVSAAFTNLLGNVASPLVVEAVRDATQIRSLARRMVRLGALVTVAGTAALLIGAPVLLGLLGSGYAEQGTVPLRLVAAAFPFTAVIVLFTTFAVLARTMRRLVAVQGVATVLFFGSALALTPRFGIAGTVLAHCATQACVALALLPVVRAQWRRMVHRSSDPSAGAATDSARPGGPDCPGDQRRRSSGLRPSPRSWFPRRGEVAVSQSASPGRLGSGGGRLPSNRPARSVWLAWIALALALLVPAALAVSAPSPVRLVLVLAFALVGPGTAVLCWADVNDPVARAGLIVAISLTAFFGVAVTMVWLRCWHPTLGVDLTALGCGLAAAARIWAWRYPR